MALEQYCLDMETRFYGLTAKDVKKMAFHLAEKNGLKHPFPEKNKSAGWKWLRSFMKRHPRLSLRKPQATSVKRIKGFTKENVKRFFDLYEPLLNLVNHNPCRVYNCDETGLTVVQHKTSKVLSLKGKRQVGAVSSAERGSLVTVVTCMSASGHFIPPLLVFPRQRMKPELLDGAPNGCIAACHKSGWIKMDGFLKWFQEQVLPSTKPAKEDPVILVLDGHYSHTRNLPLLELARDSGVHIVSLPPHCSHKMQPLDRAFMSPFKTYYAQAVENWTKQHIGREVTHYQIAGLLGEAYKKSATVATAEHGFRVTGLFPLNPDVFQAHEFAAIDDSDPPTAQHPGTVGHQENLHEISINQMSCSSNAQNILSVDIQIAGPSGVQLPRNSITQQHEAVSIQQNVSINSGSPKVMPVDISPLPSFKVQSNLKKGRGRPSCPATLLTASPYKNRLSDDISKKEEKNKGKIKPTSSKRLLLKAEPTGKQAKKGKALDKKRKRTNESASDTSDEEIAGPLTVSTDEEEDVYKRQPRVWSANIYNTTIYNFKCNLICGVPKFI